MARVVVAPTARRDLDRMIVTHSLPADTVERVARVFERLARFPRLGPTLGSRFAGRRFVLGTWRWMILVYQFEEDAAVIEIETIVDARAAPGLEAQP